MRDWYTRFYIIYDTYIYIHTYTEGYRNLWLNPINPPWKLLKLKNPYEIPAGILYGILTSCVNHWLKSLWNHHGFLSTVMMFRGGQRFEVPIYISLLLGTQNGLTKIVRFSSKIGYSKENSTWKYRKMYIIPKCCENHDLGYLQCIFEWTCPTHLFNRKCPTYMSIISAYIYIHIYIYGKL